MALVPTSFPFQAEYAGAGNYSYPIYENPAQTAMGHINWQAGYPSQIGPVNSAMNSLFPPFSRGSTQKVRSFSLELVFFSNLIK